MKNRTPAFWFLILALLSLFISALGGVLASLQYIYPHLWKSTLHFAKIRPIHVVSSVSWVVLAAIGSIVFFLIEEKIKLFSIRLVKAHFYIFLFSGLAIYFSIITGQIGGREFFVFAPIIMVGILLGWVLFAFNYFKSMTKNTRNWPVYYWMWGTGIIFMIFHLMEAHFWMLPYFRENFIKDFVIQWKSVGSFVGSWNQMVYGISIYLMAKIKGDPSFAKGKLVFFFYFLGLTNLMFGWAHHTYIIPTQPWVRIVAYIISMTEWIILIKIIYDFVKGISKEKKKEHLLAYKFLIAADVWVFLNLIIALLISIPAINYHTHGTHITVSHTMGTMIGINTMILLASIGYIISKIQPIFKYNTLIKVAYQILNYSLLFFLTTLVIAGIRRSKWMYTKAASFSEMQEGLSGVYQVMTFTGFGVFVGLVLILIPAIGVLYTQNKDYH